MASKVVDITNKLKFNESPSLKIGDETVEVNADAPTVIKMMGILSEGDPGVKEVLDIYNLIFPESSRKKIESMKLNIGDLTTVIREAVNLVTDNESNDSSGE